MSETLCEKIESYKEKAIVCAICAVTYGLISMLGATGEYKRLSHEPREKALKEARKVVACYEDKSRSMIEKVPIRIFLISRYMGSCMYLGKR